MLNQHTLLVISIRTPRVFAKNVIFGIDSILFTALIFRF